MKKIPAYKKKEELNRLVLCAVCGNKESIGEKKREELFSKLGSDFISKEAFLSALLKDRSVLWACDECFQSGKAAMSDHKKQNTGWNLPVRIYLSEKIKCRSCSEEFIFSAKEKKHWYEELGFYIYSVPVNCKDCRKKIRHKKIHNTKLGALLKTELKDEKILEEISELYEKLGISHKAELFKARAKNKRAQKK